MAKGTYVGVQGITPDLRPSIQSAIENERANRQEKRQREVQDREYELAKEQLRIKEQEANTKGVRADLERMKSWATDFEKRCLDAKSNISGLPAFSAYLADTFDEIAAYREAAMSADSATAMLYKQKAEKLYQSVLSVSKIGMDYSTLIPNEYPLDAVFTTDLIGGEEVGTYLNKFTNKDFKYVNKDGNKYITNGAVNMGNNADGEFVIIAGDETFYSADAVKQYTDGFLIKPDADALKTFTAGLDKITVDSTELQNPDGSKSVSNDIDGYENKVDAYLDNSFLRKYDDEYSWEQAKKDKDTQLIALFRHYGVNDNADTVGELKDIIRRGKMGTVSRSEKQIEAQQKTHTPIDMSINYSDAQKRTAEINRLRASNNPNDRTTAEYIMKASNIGEAIDEAITKGNLDPLQNLDYNVTTDKDGKIILSQMSSSMGGSENGDKASTNYRYTQSKESIILDPSNPTTLKASVVRILEDKKVPIDVLGMFDFNGFKPTSSDGNANKSLELQKFANSIVNKWNGSEYGDTGKKIYEIIQEKIQEYLPEGYTITKTSKQGLRGNEITYEIASPDGTVDEYTMNTNVSAGKENSVGKIVHKIIEDYPAPASSHFTGTIFNTKPVASTKPANKVGGRKSHDIAVNIFNSSGNGNATPTSEQPADSTVVTSGISTNLDE